jgi:monothiol glutaredoxin
MTLDSQTRDKITQAIDANRICLFMKGTRAMPQCGFSATVVQILEELVPGDYETVNVLADPAIREGIKEYSSWPTIPQLYIDGEFIGGCDIVRELHAAGDLAARLGINLATVTPPALTITPSAAKILAQAAADAGPGHHVRLSVKANWEPALDLGAKTDTEFEVTAHGATVLVAKLQAARLDGATIDYVEESMGAGFRIDIPKAPPKVKAMMVTELKAKLDAGELVELFDVRPPHEREKAKIEPSRILDDEATSYIESLPKDTPLVFYCRSGQRSFQAASHFLGKGFRNVYNLAGGVLEWSRAVDPSVPQY